jgi:hypothetical protein
MPSQDLIYVTYRGSTSIEDWIEDFHVGFSAYPRCHQCEVHDGFYDAEQSVIVYVVEKVAILRQKYVNATVVVTGHSLGQLHFLSMPNQNLRKWCCLVQAQRWPL